MNYRKLKSLNLLICLWLTSWSLYSADDPHAGLRRRAGRRTGTVDARVLVIRTDRLRDLTQEQADAQARARRFGNSFLEDMQDPEVCCTCLCVGLLAIGVPIMAKMIRDTVSKDAHVKQD